MWARQGLRGKATLNNTKIINEYDVRQGAGCLYSLYCLEGVSVLKNSFVPFSEPHSGAYNSAFVVFWPWFLGVWLLFWATDQSENDFFNSLVNPYSIS